MVNSFQEQLSISVPYYYGMCCFNLLYRNIALDISVRPSYAGVVMWSLVDLDQHHSENILIYTNHVQSVVLEGHGVFISRKPDIDEDIH